MDWKPKVESALGVSGLADEIADAVEEGRWALELRAFLEANRFLIQFNELPETLVVDAWYAMRISTGARPDWHKFLPLAEKLQELD